MRKLHLCFTLIIYVMLIGISCVGNPKSQSKQPDATSTVRTNSQTDEKAIIQTLKKFYIEYITACCQFSQDSMDRVQKKYCTTNLLKSFQTEGSYMEADPFLNAQDCDLKTLQTLQINKDMRTNVYKVTY